MDDPIYPPEAPPPPEGEPPREPPPPPPPPEPVLDGPAWEWVGQLGLWRAIGLTLREFLLHPAESFALARPQGSWALPALFLLVTNALVGLAQFFMMGVAIMMRFEPAAHLRESLEPLLAYLPTAMQTTLVSSLNDATLLKSTLLSGLLIVPLFLFAMTLVLSLLTHGGLLVCGGARRGLQTTFRAFAYGLGACAPLRLIPWVGSLIELFWGPIVVTIALQKMHRVETWRLVVALTLMCVVATALLAGVIILALVPLLTGAIDPGSL